MQYVELKDIMDARLLEVNKIILCGIIYELYTYESVLGQSITIPSLNVKRIDIKDD